MTVDVQENVLLNKLKFDYYTLEAKGNEIYVIDEKDFCILNKMFDENYDDWKGKYLIQCEGGFSIIDNSIGDAYAEHVNNLSVAIAWLVGESEDISGEVYIEDNRKTDVLRYLGLIKSINLKLKNNEEINFDSIVNQLPDYHDNLPCFYTALEILSYETDEIKEKNEYFNQFLLEHSYIKANSRLEKVVNSFRYLLYLDLIKLLSQNTIDNMINDIEWINEELELSGMNSEVIYNAQFNTIDSTIEAKINTTFTVNLNIENMKTKSELRDYVMKKYKDTISNFNVNEEFNYLWNTGAVIQSKYTVREFLTNLEEDKAYFSEKLGLQINK